MTQIVVVTSGKGGVGKTTTSASFAIRPRLARPQNRRHRLRRRPAQPRPDHGLRAPRGVRPDQRDPGRSQPEPGADQGQAVRQPVRAGRQPDARQGRADPGRRGKGAERPDRHGLRLHRLRFARRHRDRCADGHALRRRSADRDQPRSLQRARFRPHPGHAGQQDQARHRRQGTHQGTPADHALQPHAAWPTARCSRSKTSRTSCASS